jgi:hypothetical protein
MTILQQRYLSRLLVATMDARAISEPALILMEVAHLGGSDEWRLRVHALLQCGLIISNEWIFNDPLVSLHESENLAFAMRLPFH